MRLRAIACALFYGLAPSRLYEEERHYDCSYLRHLAMNLGIACRWLTFRESEGDREFELEVNGEHREEGFEHCNRCGRGNTLWWAPSPLWNAVMRGGSIDGEPIYNDLVCATCFMEIAEEKGIADGFKVFAERVHIELETVTPSGRVWDEDRQLWVDPQPTQPAVREAA